MAHHYSNSLYDRLADRLNQFPQGAPLSDSLFAILKILFSEKEAGLVAQLPIKPFTVDRAAAIWKLDKATAQNMLEDLAGRAMLLDMEQNGQQMFCLPPPMAGFFEFSMMRVRGDVNQKALAELYYQYLNVEEDFVKALFVENGTPLGRIFVQEAALPQDGKLEVLDYERASHIIKTASHIGVSMCYCRHKMQHLGRACDAPMDICMTFNTSARSLIKYGHARQVDAAECLDLLAVAQGHNLVQFGENAREGVNFICNCCGCCCEALLAIKRFAIARTIHSNFIVFGIIRNNGCCFQHILKVADAAFILVFVLLCRIILKVLTQIPLGSCFFYSFDCLFSYNQLAMVNLLLDFLNILLCKLFFHDCISLLLFSKSFLFHILCHFIRNIVDQIIFTALTFLMPLLADLIFCSFYFIPKTSGRHTVSTLSHDNNLLQSIGCCYRNLIFPANLMDRFLNVLIRCLSFFGVDYMDVMIGNHFLCMALYLVSVKYKN